MALASLTVDITANLSKFEGDMGRAAQIATRTGEALTRNARSVAAALEKQADQAGRTAGEYIALRAAEAGLGSAYEKTIASILKSENATAALSQETKRFFSGATQAAEDYAARQKALNAQLVESIQKVNAATQERRGTFIAQEQAGQISPDQLKTALTGLNAQRAEAIRQLKEQVAVERAAIATAAAEAGEKEKQTAANNAFVASLEKTANAIGKTRADLLAEEAALRGVGAAAAPFIAKIREADTNMGKFGRQTGITRYELLTLQYTFSDVVASLASGISPMTILLQQGGQVRDVFGSFGGALRAVGQLLTVQRVLIGGVAGGLGVLAYAYLQGEKQSRAFADSLVITGNYAGVTEGQYNKLAKSIADTGRVSESSAREFTQALISTGEIGAAVFERAARVAPEYGRALNKTAQETAADFASMSQDVTRWATEHNRQLHLLSSAQLQQIQRLQETGRTAEAQGIVYEALAARFVKLDQNLSYLDRSLRTVTNLWSKFWNAALNVGRAETPEEKIATLTRELESAQNRLASARRSFVPDVVVRRREQDVAGIQAALENEKARKDLAERAAATTAKLAAIESKATDARAYVEGFDKRAKSVDGLNRALDEARAKFAALAEAGTPVAAEKQALIFAQIRKDFSDPETFETAKKVLDNANREIERALQSQRDAFQFNNQAVQAVYAAGQVSLEDYFARQRHAIEAGADAELTALTRRRAAEQAYLKRVAADPSESEATRGRITDIDAERARVRAKASYDLELATLAEAEATRQLTDRVDEYRASLAQASGDELAAARIRNQIAERTAAQFAGQAGGRITAEELAKQKALNEAAAQFADLQNRIGFSSGDAARAEETFLLRAEQRGLSLIETERGVSSLRAQALEQLRQQRDAAQALADASTDPKLKAFAADLALQYEKAAENVDVALVKLRDAGKSAAESIAGSIGEQIVHFTSLKDLIGSIEQDLLRLGTKLLVTEPLQKFLENQIRGIIDGQGTVGETIRGIFGAGTNPVGAAAEVAQKASLSTATLAQTTATATLTATTTAQNIAATAATEALGALAFAAQTAAAAMGASGTTEVAASFLPEALSPETLAYFFHEGTPSVGSGGRRAAVPASLFRSAPRLHNGLAPDEFPAILQRGEEVVPRNRAGGRAINVTINQSFAGNASRDTIEQAAAKAGRSVQRAIARGTA